MLSVLKDKEIRQMFDLYHRKRFPTCTLLQELRVINGTAIADMVSIGHTLHCYEIKSDADKLSRALEQSKSYDLSFNKVTLLTTQGHCNHALELLPPYWGIISFEVGTRTKIKYVRAAKPSPLFSTAHALKILWREELTDYIVENNIRNISKNASRSKLINSINSILTRDQIINLIATSLKVRASKFHRIKWQRISPTKQIDLA